VGSQARALAWRRLCPVHLKGHQKKRVRSCLGVGPCTALSNWGVTFYGGKMSIGYQNLKLKDQRNPVQHSMGESERGKRLAWGHDRSFHDRCCHCQI